MSIYITGDIHHNHTISKLNSDNFPDGKKLSKEDVIIVCGDFGAPWGMGSGDNILSGSDRWVLNWYDEKPWTTLFVDGNHENFPMLYNYPIVKKHGGKCHKLNDSVFHLMRGEVYKIQGKKIFCMGGASCHDKEWRTLGINMWEEELPNLKEYQNAAKNIIKNDYSFDYIITHCLPNKCIDFIINKYEKDLLTTFFDDLSNQVKFKKWFSGHYHIDREFCDDRNNQYYAIYHDIVKIL